MARMNYLTAIEFDFGAIQILPNVLKEKGIERPLICTDKGIVAAGLLDKVRNVLGNEVSATVYDGTPPNPTENATLEAVQVYKDNKCDGLICLGGGSSIDLGKGVGILANNVGDLGEFGFGGGKIIASLPPLVAIPTTAGTGSEVSVGAVIILNDGRKMTFAGPLLVPSFAICDPELTLGLPKMLTAATGMDAVTHCIEAFLSKNVNPVADAIALDGLERAVGMGNLEKAFADGSDRDARYNMMLASTEGALSFVKGLGAVHSMSHSAGRIKELNLHHGTLNAVILPPILRFNESVVGDLYPRLRKAMSLADGADVAVAIEELNARLGLPANLSEMGVTKNMMGDLVKYADMDLANYSTPRRPSLEEFEALYLELLS